jgi:hypothetical protein
MIKSSLTILLLLFSFSLFAQQQRADSAIIRTSPAQLFDTTRPKPKTSETFVKHDPRKATFRSAVLPGWGQAYNKEYWKIPIVYAALGIPAGIFVYNNTWYKRTKFAHQARLKAAATPPDNSDIAKIDPKLSNLTVESLVFYRNEFRKSRDYSVLWFFIAWGLNVADATVFGHLKEFDVSDNLSLQLKPSLTSQSSGMSLVMNIKPAPKKLIDLTR